MNSLIKFLVSTKTMALFLIIYAVSMAVATFIENDYGTPAAKSIIYEAWWFELVMLILIINFIGNIKRYKLYTKEKLPLLIFHLSFVIIFIGGTITRYVSYEGIMKIREGQSSNEVITDRCYFQVRVANEQNPIMFTDIDYQLSPLSKDFSARYDYLGKRIEIKTIDFIERSQDSLIVSNSGKKTIELVISSDSGRKSHFIPSGTQKDFGGTFIGYNSSSNQGIQIKDSENGLLINSNFDGDFMIMANQSQGKISKNSFQSFNIRSLYSINNIQFVVPSLPKKGKIIHYSGDKTKNASSPDLVVMQVKTPTKIDTISFFGGKGRTGVQSQINQDGMNIQIGYGSKVYITPFELKLKDFHMEKYPGSDSPSSYSSDVQVIESNPKENFDYKIFMNNVLDYKGYRFFQASFDSDLQGTVLSVNHDFWGTTITYLGYFFLILGMFLTLFWKGTRFWKLQNQLKNISKNKTIIIILFIFSNFINAQHSHSKSSFGSQNSASIPTIPAEKAVAKYNFPKEHSDKFGSLLVQNIEGRIVPMNTLALQLLRKLTKKSEFHGLDANQWFLAVATDPMTWTQVPMIKIGTKGGEELLKKVGANEDGFTTLIKLFPLNQNGEPQFILEKEFQKAFNKRASEQTNPDKEVIEINEKIYIVQALISNQYIKIIPIKNDPNNTWTSWMNEEFQINEEAKSLIGPYLRSLIEANSNNKYNICDQKLNDIIEYQSVWGKNVLPSEGKIKAEIFYNSIDLFFKLMMFYSILGFLLLTLAFIKLFKSNKLINLSINSSLILIFIAMLIHAFGLGLRWYISGYAPWSNGYEAVIFISWIGVLSGFLLYKNSNSFIPAAGCLVAVIMMGFAHGGAELNPQITPLVPVLKSYWLMVHVAIITSSYGFFGLSALIGIFVLTLFIINKKELTKLIIQELTIVSELSLTVGLFLLTVGTFLGGVWANESWGRYWSWDAKETWAFISVIVYAFVLHARLVPGLRGFFAYNFMALIAFSSVIMTYFGVNYYLSGLHSYAAGDPVPIPMWIYITIAFVTILSLISYMFYRKQNIKS